MTWLGALIALCAATANASALVLQAQEARLTADEHALRFSLLWQLAHRPRWLLGTLLLTVGWPLQILALTFAALTVVQPVLASFQLILLLITRFYLRHRVGRREWLGALAVTAGVILVILAAPQRELTHPPALRLALPLALVGAGILAAAAVGRAGRRGHVIAIGAGLGYAWVDFADKLVSNGFAEGHIATAIAWLAAVAGFGVVAFLLENSALQRRSAVSVGPLIGALQEPLPVVMALVAGVEIWAGGPPRLLMLALGLTIAGCGAVVIARSPAVAAAHR